MKPTDLLELNDDLQGESERLGEGWHRRLLERMATTTEQRPVVIKEATQVGLQEYLRFRYLVRNLYADELRPEPIALLLRQLPPLWQLIQEDLLEFRHWLRSTASSHNL